MKNRLKKLVMSLSVLAMVWMVAPMAVKAEEATTAIELKINKTVAGVVENEDPGVVYKFTTLADEDLFYKFSVTNLDGNYLIVKMDDSAGKNQSSFYSDKIETNTDWLPLEANHTYYVFLECSKTNNFEISVETIKDDVKDIYTGATELTLNQTCSKSLQIEEDVDWFKFTTNNQTGRYHIILTNKKTHNVLFNDTLYLSLYDKNMNEDYMTYGPDENETESQAWDLEKNQTYYVKIYAFCMADYDITVKFNTYTITYNLDGGNNHPANPATFYEDEEITLNNPSKRGHTFGGWYLDSSCNTAITSIPKNAQKNYTVYAKWEKISLKKPNIKSLKAAKKQAKISFKAVNGAEGYEVLTATDKKFKKNAKTYTFKKAKGTMKKLKKGKTYFVKVRAYKVDSIGEKTYGKYSGAKKVKI